MATDVDTPGESAVATARGLLDPERVVAALTPRAAATLCDGLAGTALLHACLAHTGPEFAAAAARHWESAARMPGDAPPNGIHTGPGALAASLIVGSSYLPDPAPYRATVRKATTWLSARARGLARHQQRRLDGGLPGAPWAVYDAIRGVAGIGRVLLAAHSTGHEDAAEPGLAAALTTLTTLSQAAHGSRPGWWLPAADHPSSVTVHPSGAATTGLAHGIAGPLALLAISYSAGHTAPGQADAIRSTASWLLAWQEPTGAWAPFIDGDALDSTPTSVTRDRRSGRRDAWCYGVPGIGRALTLAGDALNDLDLRRAGHAAIAALAERAPPRWDTEGPGLCHGSAGVLQTAARTECGAVARQAAEHTLSFRDRHRPFGFPQVEAGAAFENPGFLTGAAGVALALADHAGFLPSNPPVPWDSLLLLA
ncbi:lanthionine synthetase C family protein [Streptomyces radicis]|uniref:Lanthionine synthetase n=1 Tax=Streptomyces radicis TaxID=1750517 RepID=A0A3A9WDS2_9ACTN|nr:lanthionine synthetase C family protein [Streptomyces radicis]RKN10453.1 lanthionine synthetase [Streptomyces radicis]RKN24712.1 lanthionine synthetase [Streptomyces radicis]